MKIKWNKQKVYQTPYDPSMGIMFFGVFVAVSASQSMLDCDTQWWIAQVVKWFALVLSFIVLSIVILNAFRISYFINLRNSRWVRKVVWILGQITTTLILVLTLLSVISFTKAEELWLGFVVGVFWLCLVLFGTRTMTGLTDLPDNREGN